MARAHYHAHVTDEKKTGVVNLTKLINEYPIIAIANLENLPARNLASMRTKLRGKVHIAMAKKNVVKKAIEASGKPGISELTNHLGGMPALLFTAENPFSLFKTLKKNQSKAAIKGGQIAPHDLLVPAGPTSFPPGPIIGELGQLGIKAGIDQGKVVIKQDAVLAKAGAVVSDKAAGFLARMGIEPMRIGLNLVMAYENGKLLSGAVLDIDEDKFKADLNACALAAKSLAFNTAYVLPENITDLVQKAHYDAAGFALEANLVTDENAKDVLAKAYYQAMGVAKYLPADMQAEIGANVADVAHNDAPAAHAPAHKEEKKEEDAAAGLGSLFG
jgi:large subunit ribosomal protein L10